MVHGPTGEGCMGPCREGASLATLAPMSTEQFTPSDARMMSDISSGEPLSSNSTPLMSEMACSPGHVWGSPRVGPTRGGAVWGWGHGLEGAGLLGLDLVERPQHTWGVSTCWNAALLCHCCLGEGAAHTSQKLVWNHEDEHRAVARSVFDVWYLHAPRSSSSRWFDTHL